MKFTKFGKTLLMSALSAGVVLGITSCVQSYSVGYLYVTGTATAQSSGNGIITGFKIDHNKGELLPINGLPISSGGANPGRAVLLTGGRFLYVLNRGVNSAGTADCTTADPCQNANITQFSIGGNGILAPQQTFFSQGINPFRIVADASGNFIYVLDHDSPSNAACGLVLAGATSCGDVTAFKVDPNTGRLSLVVNAQVTQASGSPLPYFPVPANPIDFSLASGYILTLSGTPATGDSVFPYTYNQASGQLTVNQNSSQPVNVSNGTAILYATTGYVYVLANDPITANGIPSPSQIVPFSIGSNGALQAQTGGAVPDDPTQSNPVFLLAESKGKWVYVANQGNNADKNNAQSGITGYVIDPATHQLTEMSGGTFSAVVGTGAGPQCMIEDPSNQFIYTANFNDSSVTGRVIDQNSGVLNNLPGTANRSYPLNGPAAWCVVTGRTS